MAFIRSPEPFREPPPRRTHGPLLIGIAVLLIFFVPLVVVSAMNSGGSPAMSGNSAAPSTRLPAPPPAAPPLPPPGAPWPPPPGAPTPPVCSLVYGVEPDGTTDWTAMTTQQGELTVSATDTSGTVDRYGLRVPVAVEPITLPARFAPDHRLRAVLSVGSGRQFTCAVGPATRMRAHVPPGDG